MAKEQLEAEHASRLAAHSAELEALEDANLRALNTQVRPPLALLVQLRLAPEHAQPRATHCFPRRAVARLRRRPQRTSWQRQKRRQLLRSKRLRARRSRRLRSRRRHPLPPELPSALGFPAGRHCVPIR